VKKILIILTLSLVAISSLYSKSCAEFKDWKEAEAYYNAKEAGYKNLDKDDDGKPCNSLWVEYLKKNQKIAQIKIYKYGNPYGLGMSFASMSDCEKEQAKLTNANASTGYSYKCESL